MTFEEELNAAFGEIEQEAMPVHYQLTNHMYSGVIRRQVSETPMNEVGYEPKLVIVIVSNRGQFGQQLQLGPQPGEREVVQVVDGVFAGKYVLTDVNGDLAHYELTCTLSE